MKHSRSSRKSRSPRKKFMLLVYILLALSLTLNAWLLIAQDDVADFAFNLDTEVEIQDDIKQPGTYGPSGVDEIEGNMYIEAGDVKLRNTVIQGNLYLEEGIGGGQVELHNVEVEGAVFVDGGGDSSLLLSDTRLNQIIVESRGHLPAITAGGSTAVSETILKSGALLKEDALQEDVGGFEDLEVLTDAPVTLHGNFSSLSVMATEAHLVLEEGKAEEILVEENASDTYLEFAEDTEASSLICLAKTRVDGNGIIGEAEIRGTGLSKLSGTFEFLETGGSGIYLELEEGEIEELLVHESSGTVSLHLKEDITIQQLELDGKTAVTGTGSIVKASINHEETSFEHEPGDLLLAEGLATRVDGDEFTGEPDAEASEEETETSGSGDTGGGSSGGGGSDNGDPDPDPDPDPEPEPEPDPVELFETADTPTPGKKLVVVQLSYSDPENYFVTIDGDELPYRSEYEAFRGEVNENKADEQYLNVSER